MSGHPGHLSIEQGHTLEKFKSELAAEGYYDPSRHDDPMLLSVTHFNPRISVIDATFMISRRFLRARKFDLVKAKIMWIDTQNWRKSFGVDELYDTFEYTEKADVMKLYPRCVAHSPLPALCMNADQSQTDSTTKLIM